MLFAKAKMQIGDNVQSLKKFLNFNVNSCFNFLQYKKSFLFDAVIYQKSPENILFVHDFCVSHREV